MCEIVCVPSKVIAVCREEKDETSKSQTLAETEQEEPQLDEDGYVIRDNNTLQSWPNDKGSFYSSSDSDSGLYYFVLYITYFCKFSILF